MPWNEIKIIQMENNEKKMKQNEVKSNKMQ